MKPTLWENIQVLFVVAVAGSILYVVLSIAEPLLPAVGESTKLWIVGIAALIAGLYANHRADAVERDVRLLWERLRRLESRK